MAQSIEAWLDGEHNGRPCYDYTATHGGLKFFITWASDAGFGYSISFADGRGKPDWAPRRIVWCRTLKFCKASCEANAIARVLP